MMTLENFIDDFAGLFGESDGLIPETEFKKLPEWSSLVGLSVISMVDEKYGVTLKGRDILKSQTLTDLFNTIKAKQE
ncbi:MAG: hypothetical protein ACOX6B_04930 [Thermoguttaceae bacterium]